MITSKNRKRISIVLPAYNEEFGIQMTLLAIPRETLLKNGYDIEIIVVDNNSHDTTAETAKNLGAKVIRETKQGYGHAYKKGFAAATGDILIACDGDGTYPVQAIPKLLNIFTKNNLDFLATNRFGEKNSYMTLHTMPFINRFGNMLLTLLCQLLYDINLQDSQSGMWIMRKSLFHTMHLQSTQMSFSQEIKIEAIYYLKCQWIQVPILYSDRVGTRKLNIVKHGLENLFFLLSKRYFR